MKTANQLFATESNRATWTPLLELAAREVFSLMLSSELTPAEAGDDPIPAVTSMVGMAGQLNGVLSVCCNEKAAAMMASKMLGIEPSKVGVEMADAVGEVCNMVAGNFKNKISGLGDGCLLSPPTVVTGSDYSLHSSADYPALEVRLLFEGAPVAITLQIHS